MEPGAENLPNRFALLRSQIIEIQSTLPPSVGEYIDIVSPNKHNRRVIRFITPNPPLMDNFSSLEKEALEKDIARLNGQKAHERLMNDDVSEKEPGIYITDPETREFIFTGQDGTLRAGVFAQIEEYANQLCPTYVGEFLNTFPNSGRETKQHLIDRRREIIEKLKNTPAQTPIDPFAL